MWTWSEHSGFFSSQRFLGFVSAITVGQRTKMFVKWQCSVLFPTPEDGHWVTAPLTTPPPHPFQVYNVNSSLQTYGGIMPSVCIL
jgi:hypothetical protein